ncbi:SAV_2336 N-terminal domain-related protein [Streptomyces sp. NPDC059009]|uniref:SAV_2336 N-terminal domain-related protein n=1 Tax=Streptomyces sp. NPDC059009 TaxID=3346694 RepID=UPI0036A4C830
MTVERLRDALEALGPPVTPLELAEMLWLAERLPGEGEDECAPGEGGGRPGGQRVAGSWSDPWAVMDLAFEDPVRGDGPDDDQDAAAEEDEPRDGADEEGTVAGGRLLHLPRGAGLSGSDADELLVPAPRALRHELAIQRALRPLKQRVPDRRRRRLDEDATATRAARRPGRRPWTPVMVPTTDRLLTLSLVVDTGPAMGVWRPLVRELREAMRRTGAFRDVRVWYLADLGRGLAVRPSPTGPAREPAALVDPTGRDLALVLSDCSGPHWWAGRVGPVLHRWARSGPTAILQPLPERLWRRTAAPAVPGRAIASRAGAPNTALRFTPHDGRTKRDPGTLPVPVLELSPEWLADWAGLVMATGDRRRDTAVTYVCAREIVREVRRRDGQPSLVEGDLPLEERLLRFLSAASPTAADLAAHIALSVPALPVMRLIQQHVTVDSPPSDLAEVLLSGLLEPVDGERELYEFVPGARGALLETLPRPESLAAAELLGRIGEGIAARTGARSETFRAVVPVEEGTGSRGLGTAGEPFALVSEEALGLLRNTAVAVSERRLVAAPPVVASEGVILVSDEAVAAQLGKPAEAESSGSGVAAEAESEVEAGDADVDVRPLAILEQPALIPCPPGLSNTPPPRNIIGRERELALLDEAFIRAATREPSVVAVTGLGGVGKTAVAVEWVREIEEEDVYEGVWWIDGDTADTLDEGLAALAVAVHPELPQNVRPLDAMPTELLREWALGWLQAHHCLVVVDSAAGPADIRTLLTRAGPRGSFLVLGRLGGEWCPPDTTVNVGPLELPAAVELFNEESGFTGAAADGVEELCEDLGRLPLTVFMAAAHLRQAEGTTIIEYRAELARMAAQTASEPGPGGFPPEARTFVTLALQAVDNRLATRILLVLAWFGSEPVPLRLLSLLESAPKRDRALRGLARVKLVVLDEGEGEDAATVRVHDHVRRAARVPDPDDPAQGEQAVAEARDLATLCLRRALSQGSTEQLPEHADTVAEWREIRPHIEELADVAQREENSLAFAGLMVVAAERVGGSGDPEKAISWLLRAMACQRRLLEPVDPEYLSTVGALARAFGATGDIEASFAVYADALDPLGPVLGVHHSELWALVKDVARSPSRLRRQTRERKRRLQADADARFLEILSAVEDTASGDRPTMDLQPEAFDAQLDLAESEERLAEARRTLGPEHPTTLTRWLDLTRACHEAGDTEGAMRELERLLAACRRGLAADDGFTTVVKAEVARLYLLSGNVNWAAATYDDVLATRVRTLGEEHPDTLDAREGAGLSHLALGELGQGMRLLDETLTTRTRLLGPTDPLTLRTYEHVAEVHLAQDEPRSAVEIYELTYTRRAATQGESHPDTLHSREGLARAQQAAGYLDVAIDLYQQLLEGRSAQSRPGAEIDRTLELLAQAYTDADRHEDARHMYEQLADSRSWELGEDHPDTLRARDQLGEVFEKLGDRAAAIRYYQQVLDTRVNLFGADAAEVLAVREKLHNLI